MIIRYLDPKGLGLGNCRAEKAECRGINRYSQFSFGFRIIVLVQRIHIRYSWVFGPGEGFFEFS